MLSLAELNFFVLLAFLRPNWYFEKHHPFPGKTELVLPKIVTKLGCSLWDGCL